MELKYVITDTDQFAIFTASQNHNDVASGMWGKPIAAGFLTFLNGLDGSVKEISCYGRSVSLGLQSRNHFDAAILSRALFPAWQ